jgi:hypothetical protein
MARNQNDKNELSSSTEKVESDSFLAAILKSCECFDMVAAAACHR